jgi:hypothetical protein
MKNAVFVLAIKYLPDLCYRRATLKKSEATVSLRNRNHTESIWILMGEPLNHSYQLPWIKTMQNRDTLGAA